MAHALHCIVLVLLTLVGQVLGVSECPFGFSACSDAPNTSACAMFTSACGNCSAGDLVCPGTGGASGVAPHCAPATNDGYLECPLQPWRNTSLSLASRVAAVVEAVTLAEAAAQLINTAPAIERLGIPAYNWWNEGLHGVAFAGVATMFPQVHSGGHVTALTCATTAHCACWCVSDRSS